MNNNPFEVFGFSREFISSQDDPLIKINIHTRYKIFLDKYCSNEIKSDKLQKLTSAYSFLNIDEQYEQAKREFLLPSDKKKKLEENIESIQREGMHLNSLIKEFVLAYFNNADDSIFNIKKQAGIQLLGYQYILSIQKDKSLKRIYSDGSEESHKDRMLFAAINGRDHSYVDDLIKRCTLPDTNVKRLPYFGNDTVNYGPGIFFGAHIAKNILSIMKTDINVGDHLFTLISGDPIIYCYEGKITYLGDMTDKDKQKVSKSLDKDVMKLVNNDYERRIANFVLGRGKINKMIIESETEEIFSKLKQDYEMIKQEILKTSKEDAKKQSYEKALLNLKEMTDSYVDLGGYDE